MTTAPLRRATPADAAAIKELVLAAYAKYLPRIGRPPAPMIADYAVSVKRHQIWVAESESGLAAVLELIPEENVLLLENIAVAPDLQRRGIGRRLLDFAEAEARRQGLGSIRLFTNEKMVENIALYESLGYRETGRQLMRGRYAVHMRKSLPADRKD